MKRFNLNDIRKMKPCYDPAIHAAETWEGTILDVLKTDSVPAKDRVWLATRQGVLPTKLLQKFAIWCVREALKTVPTPDPRSVKAVDTAEAYLAGTATLKELQVACKGAYAAAYAADAADASADAAAYAADAYAAGAAAYADAAYAADAAKDKARKNQVSKLIELIETGKK